MSGWETLAMVVGWGACAGLACAYEPDTRRFPKDPVTLPACLENLRPGQIRDAVKQGAACLLPVGTLDAEGPFLGMDPDACERMLRDLAVQHKAVIAPPIWYGPTGYVLSGPGQGTFDMPPRAFSDYLREVLVTLDALGFRKILVVPLRNPPGDASALRSAIDFALGDLFNDLWKRPEFGPNWWIRPDRDQLNWGRWGVLPAPKPKTPAGTNAAPERPFMQLPLRLEHLRPAEFAEAIRRGLPCFVAVGVLENHGNQCPVACDAFEAQDPLLLAAAQAPCVVAPTVWYGPTAYAVTGPALGSTDINGQVFQTYARGLVAGLAATGFRHIVVLQNHQGGGAQRTGLALAIQEYRAGLWQRPGFGPGWGREPATASRVPEILLTGPPGGQYDHAGKNETSWMLHLRGPYTDLSLLRKGDYPFCWAPNDESEKATADWGRQMCNTVVSNLVGMIRERTAPPAP
jgi:creatinine amidohydrolase/Fe(II)-dependent formamide hydrolase-like protein